MNRTLLIAAVLGLTVAGAAHADDKDLDALKGKWLIVSLLRDGKADDAMKDAVRVHDGTKYTVTPKTGTAVPGTFKIDGTKTPKTMDMSPTEGRYKDKTLLGIYEIKGDTLTVCFAEPGKERPTKFASEAGSGWVLVVHKLQK